MCVTLLFLSASPVSLGYLAPVLLFLAVYYSSSAANLF
jgi:hypothetical protein